LEVGRLASELCADVGPGRLELLGHGQTPPSSGALPAIDWQGRDWRRTARLPSEATSVYRRRKGPETGSNWLLANRGKSPYRRLRGVDRLWTAAPADYGADNQRARMAARAGSYTSPPGHAAGHRMKRTYQPKKRKRARTHGFRARMR